MLLAIHYGIFLLRLYSGDRMLKVLRNTLLAVSIVSLAACAAKPGQESTGQYLDSSAITAKVKSSLVDSLGAKAFHIKVKTYKDSVQLSGFVANKTIKVRAGSVAAKVKNVKHVTNDLIIKR